MRLTRDGQPVRVLAPGPGVKAAGAAPAEAEAPKAATSHRPPPRRSTEGVRHDIQQPEPATDRMSLFELCIRRPVLATVLSLLVLVIGLISYSRLAVREYPKIDEPVVSVQHTLSRRVGRSHRVADHQGARGLARRHRGLSSCMTSFSRPEQSNINVRFRLTRDPDSAAADVRDKVARVRARLPDNVDEPVIAKVEADSFPVIWMAVSSANTHAARGLGLPEPLHQAAPVGAAGRGGCAHLRRAQDLDAHLTSTATASPATA